MPPDHEPGEPQDLNLLAAFVESRLGPDERRGLERHLTECASCRATLSTWSGALPGPVRRSQAALPVWLGAAAAIALAAWLGSRVASTRPGSSSPMPADGRTEAPVLTAPVLEPTRAATRPEEPLQTKRGGERRVGEKTFRLVAGEWVDSAFDPVAGLPTVHARSAEERRALLRRQPALAPYARLGSDVTVVLDGTVYRFLPQAR